MRPERLVENKTQKKPDKQAAKKPYHKPSFRDERVFETMALACGKTNPQSLQCNLNRKTS